jgi:hypothetical protein
MRTAFFVVCVLSLIFFVNFFVSVAGAVEISVTPAQGETEVNQNAWYNIQIYNELWYPEEFIITVLGPHLEWLNLESYYVLVGPSASRDIKMYFYPSLENSYEYEVVVYSKNNALNKISQKISLKVLPEKEVRILGLTCSKAGDTLEIELQLSSKEKRALSIPLEIVDSSGNRVKYAEVTKEFQGAAEIKETMPIGDLLAGNYYVRASVPAFDVSGETTFSIQPVHNVLTKKEVISTPFGQEVIITITNEGNTIEDYSVMESLPSNQYIDFVEPPINTYVGDNNVNYNWVVEGLAVGKSATVRYNISRLPLLVGSFIMVFCVVALLGMGAVRVRTPLIRKRHVRRKGEHIIILQIKGALTSPIKGVMVKDRVTPLGRVVQEFGGPKPVVREGGESGTELIWNLGDLKPRSEIYLSYRIQPFVEAQLKMPRAYLTYRTDDDTKMRVFSKQVILE